MAPTATNANDRPLRLVCPHCAYALDGLPVPGTCPECGGRYSERTLRDRDVPPTPRWVVRTTVTVALLWVAAFTVSFVPENGLAGALFGGGLALAGAAASVILLLAGAHWMGTLRGPNAGGVVAGCGLAGMLLGGPGFVLLSVHENGSVDPFVLVTLPFSQVMAAMAALLPGTLVAAFIPPSGNHRRPDAPAPDKDAP